MFGELGAVPGTWLDYYRNQGDVAFLIVNGATGVADYIVHDASLRPVARFVFAPGLNHIRYATRGGYNPSGALNALSLLFGQWAQAEGERGNVRRRRFTGEVAGTPHQMDDWYSQTQEGQRILVLAGALQDGKIQFIPSQGSKFAYNASGLRESVKNYLTHAGHSQRVVNYYAYILFAYQNGWRLVYHNTAERRVQDSYAYGVKPGGIHESLTHDVPKDWTTQDFTRTVTTWAASSPGVVHGQHIREGSSTTNVSYNGMKANGLPVALTTTNGDYHKIPI